MQNGDIKEWEAQNPWNMSKAFQPGARWVTTCGVGQRLFLGRPSCRLARVTNMTVIQTSERKGKSEGVCAIVAHAGLVAVGYVENAGWSEDGILPT